MDIREAWPDDNDDLKALQLKCPQGKKLIVSVVNTPDFFARAKAYESSKVYVALDGGRIIGSAALATRNAVVNGEVSRIGYSYQAFVVPEYRRKGVVNRLEQQAENFATQQDMILMYGLVIGDNKPSMRWLEHRGYKLHKKLVVAGMPVYKEMDVLCKESVRQASLEDLPAVAEVLNETWQGFEMYEPVSAQALKHFVSRTPGYSFNNLLVLQDGDEILACLGYWDWGKIMRITVEALSLKIRMMGLIVRAAGLFRPMPRPLKPGDILKQIILTPIGFKDPAYLSVLLRHVNNQALQMGIEQIFCVCDRDPVMLNSMSGFIRINTTCKLYVKPLRQHGLKADKPVYIDGIDL
jgi:N-acetylglutamate synthase-like GNAT family acetyltransferase